MFNHFLNIISCFLPSTRWFYLKKILYQMAGVDMGVNVCFGNCIKFYSQGKILINSNVWIGRGAEFTVPKGSMVTIGNGVDIGPNVKFMCGSHKIGNENRRAGEGIVNDIQIDDGVWIGTEVLILGGVKISSGSIIGAGSLVLPGIYPSDALLAGVPASVIKKLPSKSGISNN